MNQLLMLSPFIVYNGVKLYKYLNEPNLSLYKPPEDRISTKINHLYSRDRFTKKYHDSEIKIYDYETFYITTNYGILRISSLNDDVVSTEYCRDTKSYKFKHTHEEIQKQGLKDLQTLKIIIDDDVNLNNLYFHNFIPVNCNIIIHDINKKFKNDYIFYDKILSACKEHKIECDNINVFDIAGAAPNITYVISKEYRIYKGDILLI